VPPATDLALAVEPLRQLLGADSVSTNAADLLPYLEDERGAFHGRAHVLVQPASTDAVARLLAYCSEHAIGIVPQGGNTGYCGAGTPFSDAHILLKLDRMNRVRELSKTNFTMTAETGVTLQRVKDEALAAGLDFPLSLGSQGSCQLGGVLSTNAGGLNALRYGVARDLVLGLEVVLPDGRVLNRAQGLRKDNTGYRWCDLFLGAEGTLGVITAASIKLMPLLQGRATALLAFATLSGASAGLLHFRQACDDSVVAFELLTQGSIDLATALGQGSRLPVSAESGLMVLVEVAADTSERATERLEAALQPAMEQGLVIDGALASSLSQRESLWRFREDVPEAEKRAGGSIKHDVSLPVQHLEAFVNETVDRLRAFEGARLSVFGHLGDGNLHFNVLAPAGADAQQWRHHNGSAVTETVLAAVAEFGGSFSAEHGIGVSKLDELERYRSDELGLMQALKAVFDPLGIMNPGKVLR